MADTAKITCRASANGSGLHLVARLDDRIFFQGDPEGTHELSVEFEDDDNHHLLRFELTGKNENHTKVDTDGKILEDITVLITDIKFDDIELGHIVVEKSLYEHDFNGTASAVKEPFYGVMGCNGTVTLEFTTPIYLWLLENM